MYDPEQITYFAETDARNRNVPFGIKAKDRTRHVYVIGKTGMGKSTILENMAVQDIQNGNGFAFIDPHGKTADLFLEYIPEERKKDVLYFAPFDMDYPISFNIMEDVGYDKRHLVVSGLMASFKKIWQDAWSARMEYILSNTLLALLEYPDSTLLSVNKMLADKPFREKVVANIQDTSVKSFWVDEFAKYTDRFAAEATPAIQNKIGQFTSNPLIRNIVGQPKSSFDIRKMMDERKILIINLSKGRIGEANANLLGSLLITKIYLSAMSRADVPERVLENELPNFYLYVDEFQSFANESFADILSEARKYKLNLTIAHQYIEQMSDEVRAAVFGNVGSMITFRVGSYDSEVLEKEFAPDFTSQDIVNLGRFQIYLRLMIDNIGSKPFSARTLPPLEKPEHSIAEEIIDLSRKTYGRPRDIVEEEVRALVEMGRDEASGQSSSDGKGGNKGGGKGGGKGNSGFGTGGNSGGGRDGGFGGNSGGGTNSGGGNGSGAGGNNRSAGKSGGRGSDRFGSEDKKPVIDEKTKNELNALLAKYKEPEIEDKVDLEIEPDTEAKTEPEAVREIESKTKPEVESATKPEVDEKIVADLDVEMSDQKSQTENPIHDELAVIEEKPHELEIIEEKEKDLLVVKNDTMPKQNTKSETKEETRVDMKEEANSEVKADTREEAKTETKTPPKTDDKVADLQSKINKIMDRDLKEDLQPMMVSPASRNDPKKVSPENKNQLADALKAALGDSFVKKDQPIVKFDKGGMDNRKPNSASKDQNRQQANTQNKNRQQSESSNQNSNQSQNRVGGGRDQSSNNFSPKNKYSEPSISAGEEDEYFDVPEPKVQNPSPAMNDLGSMTDAINSILNNTNAPEFSPKPDTQNKQETVQQLDTEPAQGMPQTPRSNPSQASPKNEVPEEELRAILRD